MAYGRRKSRKRYSSNRRRGRGGRRGRRLSNRYVVSRGGVRM